MQTAERMIRKGKMSLEDIADCVPNLTMDELKEIEAARQFFQKWANRGKENEDDRSYWIDLLTRILGVEEVTDHIVFQKKVIVDGNTKSTVPIQCIGFSNQSKDRKR
jgi:hypothetical protein